VETEQDAQTELLYTVQLERRAAWRNESWLIAAVLLADIATTSFLIARDSGFGGLSAIAKVGIFVVVAWVVAIPVLGAIWLLGSVISRLRQWRGDGPDRPRGSAFF
jgi:hypothetical protein